MMFEVAIGDKVRSVAIIRKGGMLHVDLDGRTHIVDARRVNESVVSMLVQLDGAQAPSRSVDAAFASQQTAGDFDVYLDGLTIPVQIRPAGAFGRQKKEGSAAHASGPQRLVAPMPGKVVRVLVKPGDEVKARQGLVVVEAMKMENELRAARDGRVRDVAVAEGQSVDAGAVLLVVE
ncbi:MAG TPA: biotin/lipoyl-containing protein [Vicinamibacterales bacterium]|nr:biotin/lipoyl-containing protein [Vicinamibacterales bacterium]